MALKLEDKKAMVKEVAEVAATALSAVVADYRGLTAGEMTALREEARKAGIYFKVVRNTLTRRAVENTDFTCLSEALVGPVFVAFAKDDPGAVARLLKDAAKENEKLVVRALAVGGKLLPPDQLEVVASLPTREKALALLLSAMKAPMTQLVRTMAEPCAMLVRTLAAVGRNKAA